MRDLYEVLGVARGANQTDLKKAYRRCAQKYHPDKNPNDKDAEEKFKEAANAYQILTDAERRTIYDRHGFEGLRGRGPVGNEGPGFTGFSNVEDIFSAFGDLFGDFFSSRGSSRSAHVGTDLRVELKLTFAEAVWGATKDVKVTRAVPCVTCAGSRAAPGTKPELCGTCKGKGHVMYPQGFFMVQSTCSTCHGAGHLVKEACATCRGRGTQTEASTLAVTVPPGVDDGQTLRLANKGTSTPGGTPGHLYVVLHVQDDERFQRDGDDVVTEVSISFVDAALGGEVEIDTLDDDTATLELPPGTQPGDVVVRRGQGIPRIGRSGRGDQIVQWKIQTPTKMSARQRALLREFAELDD